MLTVCLMLALCASDVGAIFEQHCVQCHHVGGMAPFSVETYDQARPWAKSIARAVATKQMPPFGADGPIGKYVDDPRLTDAEIDAVVAWARRPGRYEAIDYAPPKPPGQDVIIEFAAYPFGGTGEDQWVMLEATEPLSRAMAVDRIVWNEGNAPIHHAVLGFSRKALPGGLYIIDSVMRRKAPRLNKITLSAYLPGTFGHRMPDGYAVAIDAGTTIVATIHVGPEATYWDSGRLSVGLIEAEPGAQPLPQPFVINMKTMMVGDEPFLIPARSKYVRSATNTAQSDMRVHAFTVHMHRLGESVVLRTESGETLASISGYSEEWQLTYPLAEPFIVRKGERLTADFTWDNPYGEPVRYGQGAHDEMGWIKIIWTPPDDSTTPSR